MNLTYLFSFFSFGYLYFVLFHDLHVLQQNVYNENNRYLKWGLHHNKQLFSFASVVVFFLQIINLYFQNFFVFFFFLFYVLDFLYFLFRRKKESIKIPLKITSRLKRLMVTIFLIYSLPFFFLFFSSNIYVFYVFFSGLIFFHFLVVYFSNVINYPIEKAVFLYYKRKAMKKLSRYSHMKVIGITGSYGKTSSKNILNDILSVKFNSFASPLNYNTQYGLMITINRYLDKYEDIFIAEMGAYKRGRIQLCCNLVKPSIGIITNIGTAHLETFGSRENIQKGKFELIESLPSDGLAVLNKDDSYQVNYPLRNTCEKLWISVSDTSADVVAQNIQMSYDGMTFDVFFKSSKKTVSFSTKLLGIPNVYNILASLAISNYLGLSMEEMQLGVKKISTIPHRMELKKHGDYTIIDDAYNSNPVGSKMALDVLQMMDGKKVVVTPGMVELGKEQYRYNKEFGEQISEVADVVILVGESQTKPILDGLMNCKFPMDHIIIAKDIQTAFQHFPSLKEDKRHTYFLLENDLPDIYNE